MEICQDFAATEKGIGLETASRPAIARPHVIEFQSIGKPSIGYLTIAEPNKNIPFDIKRVYWTYYTPHEVTRGHHAHKELQQILVAVAGSFSIKTEGPTGEVEEFKLSNPHIGLYVPRLHWREIQFSHSAVLLCMASLEYFESDYIRSYEEFREVTQSFK